MTYPVQPPPPRSSQTAWIVLGAIAIGILVLCGGCLSVAGLGLLTEPEEEPRDTEVIDSPTKERSDSVSPREQRSEPEGERGLDTPTEVAVGSAFEHDDFAIASGWRVGREAWGDVTITDLSVSNQRGDRRTAVLVFRFYRGKRVLAEVNCSSYQMQEGETSPMVCYSGNDFPDGYDAVKVSDRW